MHYSKGQLWERFQKYYLQFPEIGLALDLSRMSFPDDFFTAQEPRIQNAYAGMRALEKGAIANPDEKRMVGHYWLRNSALAPNSDITHEIDSTIASIKTFAADVHSGRVKGAGGRFENVLLIGIGGSALGPQFVSNALSAGALDKMRMYFLDNTDPDGIDNVLSELRNRLPTILVLVISKSGGTKETRNGMLEAAEVYRQAGLDFARHAVAVTGRDSELDKLAVREGWLTRFPMWDWVGGRTSELSAVGLLPAALQGIDFEAMLRGAKACDEITRRSDTKENPSAQIALMWLFAGNGRGSKNLVVLPYKDRLQLFSKYLQQLLMESLGKCLDLEGRVVNQGITVFGNKGSTDQHSYIQQLRDGLDNFFVTFIEVLRDRVGKSIEVEPGVTSGDYLEGFMLGTREALFESGRQSMTITIDAVSPFAIGVLIALFERAVGLYASLININAYHQPGVEAGKKAAKDIIELQAKVQNHLASHKGEAFSVERIAEAIGARDSPERIFKICEHLSSNQGRGIEKVKPSDPGVATYRGI